MSMKFNVKTLNMVVAPNLEAIDTILQGGEPTKTGRGEIWKLILRLTARKPNLYHIVP